MVTKLTTADYNDLWNLTRSVYLTPDLQEKLTALLLERAELQEKLVSSKLPKLGFQIACPCGDSGKPGHPVEGYCRKGLGGV